MKKYKLTNNTKKVNDIILYQIEALKDFGDVKKGDLGGWVESENNLSHNGDCWVFDNGMVYENGIVSGNGEVYGNGQVYGNGWVSGDGEVSGNGRVFDNGWVCGYGKVYEDGMVFGYGKVLGNGQVFENGAVFGYGQVSGNGRVFDRGKVYGNTILKNFDSISDSNQVIPIQGFKHNITVTYASINIGCRSFSLDELDKSYEELNIPNEISELEFETIKKQCEISLAFILEKMSE